MSKDTNVLEIEIDGPRNESLAFRPLQRKLRGRFDLNRVAEPLARIKTADWPQAIPGQRLRIDLDRNEACIIEPLHEEAHAPLRERIETKGKLKLPPARQPIAQPDMPTLLFWIGRAVSAGLARIVSGSLPETIDGPVQKSFITKRPAASQQERMMDTLANELSEQKTMLAEHIKASTETNKLLAQVLAKLAK